MEKQLLEVIAQRLQEATGKEIILKNAERVYGGDIYQTFVLHTSAGNYFLKVNSADKKDMFQKEFNGLKALHDADAIHVPSPIFYGSFANQIFLLTEYIEKGNSEATFWRKFGYDLAQLHRHTQDRFGLKENNYIGSVPQDNQYYDSWPSFYEQNRIMPLIRKAYDENKCLKSDVSSASHLCKRLAEIFPAEPPALLHGDLWAGNFMVNKNGEAVVFDPAVYFGHREMDIAMSLLFGGFDRSFYDHYNQAFRLEKNWRQRIAICQLYPLLVHLILFGGHYYNDISRIINSFK